MNHRRFDAFTRRLARRAQDAPADPHPGANANPEPDLLFVQAFRSGTLTPKDGEDEAYTLTIAGALGQTAYFSDRPERLVGLTPTETFLGQLGFTPGNPPNAALVTQAGDDAQEVLVVELTNPTLAADAGSLAYDVKALAGYEETALQGFARQQDDLEFPAAFDDGGLFIDDGGCSPIGGQCYQVVNGDVEVVGELDIQMCFDIGHVPWCQPCHDDGTDGYYGVKCAEQFPDRCHYSDAGWDCFGRGGGI